MMKMLVFQSEQYSLYACEAALVYRLCAPPAEIPLAWPVLEIGGESVRGAPDSLAVAERRFLNDRIEQITLRGMFGGHYTLELMLRVCAKTPFVRFSFRIEAAAPAYLSKAHGDNLTYFSWPDAPASRQTEVRLSDYNALYHGYCLREVPAFRYEDELLGPMLADVRDGYALLAAYEHGSTYPDKYLCFAKTAAGTALKACRGNYWANQPLHKQPLETIWFQFGAVAGDLDDLAKAYRAFQLSYCSLNTESRRPYIFYNTWAFQERNKFYNKQQYLSSMHQARIEQEIEIAHRMGVDVFVIDTGWFEKTGDWLENPTRFPDGMKHIHDLLAQRGMKLGLWFGPTSAARSSEILKKHLHERTCMEGETPGSFCVWETEESYEMCMASSFWEDFADRLIDLAKTVGVRYFKWDSVEMYGCDRANHFHGGDETTAADRHDCYSFLAGVYLCKAVDKLCAAVPDAIVDMDITEAGRFMGLGFLSSGKYFATNNGPYYQNYDIRMPETVWSNIFVQPGPARPWIMRQGLCFDKWIPSVLLMAHYLPDDPVRSQRINLASLMLGQNGIWGDLPAVSDAGVALFGRVLGVYKKLRDDITRADPAVYGRPGETMEAYEKVEAATGRGMVALFLNRGGRYSYRLLSKVDGDAVVFGPGRLIREGETVTIEAAADESDAVIVFFGETQDSPAAQA